ncbi:MAG: hypothetical protein H6Q12_493 [Bacteroidetes bacterium]|nr:hypothetical protein [Bacteroidota bacterium]
MKKIIYCILLLFVAFGFQSCVDDEKEVFNKSASERMSEALANYSKILQSPKNGWRLRYYAGADYAYGGYNMLVSFADGKANVASEITETDTIYRSGYDLISNQGPVLTFDTFNPVMHFFGTPSSSSLDGYQGDYEFVIMSASADSVVLKGKKWGNKMVMTPMPEKTEWKSYLDSIVNIQNENIYPEYVGTIGSKETKLSFTQYHTLEISSGGSSSTNSYICNTKGIEFNTPADIAGHTFNSLSWNNVDTTFVGTATDGTKGSFKIYISPEYKKYIGTWNITINGTIYTANVAQNVPGQSFTVKSTQLPYPFVANYSSTDDKVSVLTQDLGIFGEYTVKLCPWDANAGYLTWSDNIGMESTITSKDPLTLTFANNGRWSSYTVNSYLLYLFDSAGNRIGKYTGGNYKFPFVTKAVKVQ